MKIRWDDVNYWPNDVSEEAGIPCPHCRHLVPHEVAEIYASSDGRVLNVVKVQSANRTARIWVDA